MRKAWSPADEIPDRGDFYGDAKPCLPTLARPGTAAKLLVLQRRFAAKQELSHPLDADMPPRRVQSAIRADVPHRIMRTRRKVSNIARREREECD